MQPDRFLWQLAGPRAFFGRVCAAIDQHHDVGLGLPYGAPGGFLAAMESLFQQQSHSSPTYVDVLERESVADAIQHKLDQDVPISPWRLAQLYDYAGEVLLLNGETETSQAAIHEYLTDHARLSLEERRRGPALLTLLPLSCLGSDGTARPPQGAAAVLWKNVVTATDMDVYVAYRTQNRVVENEPPLIQSYIRSFSGLDPLMTERLLGLTDDEILALPSSARAWVADKGDLWRTPNWLNGSVEQSAKRLSLHPLYEIHTQDLARITRRAWAAQMQALMPWMEFHRDEMIRPELTWIRKLPQPLHRQNGSLYDLSNLEINDVWNIGRWLAKRNVSADLPLFSLARKVRNHIAHRQAAPTEEIKMLIAGIRDRVGV